jgi:hypothetical protein
MERIEEDRETRRETLKTERREPEAPEIQVFDPE